MGLIELVKVIIFGIVEGITEWLPISSTGHMILVDEFIQLNVSSEFMELFLVVIQLGAIMSVVVLYWEQLFPFTFQAGKGVEIRTDMDKISMWLKILAASIPAGIVGILWEDELNNLFYNYVTVAVMLVLFGILFIVIENQNKSKKPKVNTMTDLTYSGAFFIGIFQMIAAAFPGTSRSGATIVGALLIGISRTTAAEFTFFLAIPAMLGGSAIKLLKFGFCFSSNELAILLIGSAVAFSVSVWAIKFLVGYIRMHDFKAFGYYRITLGTVLLAYFFLKL